MNRLSFLLLPGILLFGTIVAAQGIKVMPGTTFKLIGGNLDVVLANGANFENNNTLQNGNISIKATGTGTSQIKGTGALTVGSILVNKTAGENITLMKDVTVANDVTFTSGTLDLNGKNILLSDTALLVNETETSRIVGDSGSVQIQQNLDAPLAENPGNLGLIITSGASWGNTLVKRSNSTFTNVGGNNSIARSYSVQPTVDSGLNAFLRMYYKDAELNGLDENTLTFYSSTDSGNTWSNIGVVSRNTTQNFVNINGVQSLSLLTLSIPSVPLALELTDIETKCDRNKVQIQWHVASTMGTSFFRMMKSNDGDAWQIAADRIAVIPDASHLYTFNDAAAPAAFYRLEGHDFSGKVYYSPVQSAPCKIGNASFQLMENPVYNELRLGITSKQDQNASIQILDIQGRSLITKAIQIPKGNSKTTIDAGSLATGIYSLRIISENQEMLWHAKFVKQ